MNDNLATIAALLAFVAAFESELAKEYRLSQYYGGLYAEMSLENVMDVWCELKAQHLGNEKTEVEANG